MSSVIARVTVLERTGTAVRAELAADVRKAIPFELGREHPERCRHRLGPPDPRTGRDPQAIEA